MSVDIAKLRELLAAAEPRPWQVWDCEVVSAKSDQSYVALATFGNGHEEAELTCTAVNALPQLLAVFEAAFAASEAFEQCGIEPHWNGYDKDQQRCVDAMEALRKLVTP